jgi:hypothetical protein
MTGGWINARLRQRAELLLMGGYREDEVVSNLLVEYPSLDEFQQEDLPKIVKQVGETLSPSPRSTSL